MRKIPHELRDELSDDPYYQKCVRRYDGGCFGRITWEHSFIYAGKQINERWAIIPLCWYHHLGEGLNKEKNQFIALSRATAEDFLKYPRKDWEQLFHSLSSVHSHGKIKMTWEEFLLKSTEKT